MGLSTDLISQFVKVTNDRTKPKDKTTTVYGTVKIGDDGQKYVQIDGSEMTTPVSSTVDAKEGDRVTLTIKNHNATITGNVTDPSASSDKVSNSATEITKLDAAVANRVTTETFNATQATVNKLVTDNATITETLKASNAEIANLKTKDATIEGKITASNAEIAELKTNKLDVESAEATYATIVNLDATNANVNSLSTTYAEVKGTLEAKTADIETLKTNKLDAESAKATYANIDFSNIGKAAIEYIYAKTGLISDIDIGDATITGKLVGVTISGDLIEANTLKADKLVVKGENGLYYKLNINSEGMIPEQELDEELKEKLKYGLLGNNIIANSITADKISVSDLVAFGATVGGFKITDHSLFSDVKDSVENTTRGIYMDTDGQVNFGDDDSFIKYFKEETTFLVEFDGTNYVVTDGKFENPNGEILEGVTTTTGKQVYKQTNPDDTVTYYCITESYKLIISASDILYSVDGGERRKSLGDLGRLGEYIHIGTYEDEPSIELGESDSDFRLIITNTRILFMDGSTVPAYLTNESLVITKAEIKEELKIGKSVSSNGESVSSNGEFVWKVRSNGNLGLSWKPQSNDTSAFSLRRRR